VVYYGSHHLLPNARCKSYTHAHAIFMLDATYRYALIEAHMYTYTYRSKYLYKYEILQILYSLIMLLIALYNVLYSAQNIHIQKKTAEE